MIENDEKSLDSILDRDENDVARVTESVFKANLLPVLVNNDEDGSLQTWLNIAGSWHRPVEVLDDKTGEALFTVPALVGKTGMPTLQRADNSAYDLIENAQKKMRVVPRAGDEMLIRGLTNRVRVEGDRQKAVDTWNQIYRRYGYDDLVVKSITDENATSAKGNADSSTDFSGYDEA